jgi:hypothetical protein
MVRFPRAVAALLMLLMIGGRVLTAACEIACSFDAGGPHTGQTEHPCHESSPVPLDPDLLSSRAPHSSCGHDDAEPFVVAAKSILDAHLHAAKVPGSTRVKPQTSDRSQNPLRAHTPRDTSAAPAAPLRI